MGFDTIEIYQVHKIQLLTFDQGLISHLTAAVCVVPLYLIIVPLYMEQDYPPEQHEAPHAEEGEPHGVHGVHRSPYPALLLLVVMHLLLPPRLLLSSFLNQPVLLHSSSLARFLLSTNWNTDYQYTTHVDMVNFLS